MVARVSDNIEFRPDLFRGTAGYYDRFRVGYPQPLLDDIVRRAAVTGDGRLLDLACGTGQIAFALADVFAEVWAVDQEPDMISLVRDKAVAAGADHVNPVVSTAEDLAAPDGAFELVTVGNPFTVSAAKPSPATSSPCCSRADAWPCWGLTPPGEEIAAGRLPCRRSWSGGRPATGYRPVGAGPRTPT